MPAYTRDDLEGMASDIVRKFLGKECSLEDGILDKAKESLMNSDQIKRLVEMANTSAFLDMFKGTSGGDRMVEFNVADPSVVIKRYYNGKAPDGSPARGISETSITVVDHSDDSDEDDSRFFDDISDALSKEASCGCSESCECHECSSDSSDEMSLADIFDESKQVKESSLFSRRNISIDKYRKQDILDSLLTKKAGYELDFDEAAEDISASFRGMYSREKHASFELDSMARHGNSAMPLLSKVRQKLGMPKIARLLTSEEEYAIKDRHIIESSRELKKLGSAINSVAEYLKVSQAIERLSNE